jgi:hypothetical protein
MTLDELKTLAGVKPFRGLAAYGGSNISVTGNEKAEIMKKHDIRPGTPEWFRLF